jgi:hypothetical protein
VPQFRSDLQSGPGCSNTLTFKLARRRKRRAVGDKLPDPVLDTHNKPLSARFLENAGYLASYTLCSEAHNIEVGSNLSPRFRSLRSEYLFVQNTAVSVSTCPVLPSSAFEHKYQQGTHWHSPNSVWINRNTPYLTINSNQDSHCVSELDPKAVPASERLYMPDSTSKTWVSFEQMEVERWRFLKRQIDCMYPADRPGGNSSPFVPRSFEDYVQHRKEMQEAEVELVRRQLLQAQQKRKYEGFSRKVDQAFGGKKFGSLAAGSDGKGVNASANPPNRAPVLAQRSIWSGPISTPWRTPAPWPCMQEMQWEGDQRVATENGRYGRFPPLPREAPAANDPAPWHTREMVEFEPIDQVWRVPTIEDICAPIEEVDDPEIVAQLLNQELLLALDDNV